MQVHALMESRSTVDAAEEVEIPKPLGKNRQAQWLLLSKLCEEKRKYARYVCAI